MKLTLLCPTFNRHHFLKRNCQFWANRDINVIYADGSQFPFDSPLLNSENILYLHRPVSMYQRIVEMVALVNTPYVCIMGDDEYFIPSALHECCSFLDHNPDFVSCMGRAVGFTSHKDGVQLSNIYNRLQDRNLSSSDSYSRLHMHFASYVPSHIYAVTRLDVFSKAIHESFCSELDVFAIKELIHEFTVISLGKTNVIPSLYWLRCLDVPPMRNTDLSLDPSKPFRKWWKLSRYVDQKRDFCRKLSMIPKCGFSEHDVEEIFDFYVDNTISPVRRCISRFRFILSAFLLFIKPITLVFQNTFLNLLKFFPFFASQPPCALRRLSGQGVSVDYPAYSQCIASIKESSIT